MKKSMEQQLQVACYFLLISAFHKKVIAELVSIGEKKSRNGLKWRENRSNHFFKDQSSISRTFLGQFVLVFPVVQSEMSTVER